MKQVIIGGYASDTLSNAASQYNHIMGGRTWYGTANDQAREVVPTAGTFNKLRVKLNTAPTTNAYTFTVMVNNSATALTCTVAVGNTEADSGELYVDVTAGQTIELRSSFSAAPGNTPTATWSLIFTGSTSGESILMGVAGGHTTSTLSSNPAGNAYSTVENRVNPPLPTPGTFQKLYVVATWWSSGGYYDITLRENGVNTAITCRSTDSSDANDTTHTNGSVAGDLICLQAIPSTTPAAPGGSTLGFGLVFVSDTDGESLIMNSSDTAPSTSSDNYMGLCGLNTVSAVEANQNQLTQSCTLRNFYVATNMEVLTGSYTLTVRLSGATSGITCTIDSGTTGNDTTHSDTPTDPELGSILIAPTSTPTAVRLKYSLVSYIANGLVLTASQVGADIHLSWS